jgi:Dyp-type peroxidase family
MNHKMKTPVDPSDFETSRILKNLQGNIIKGHGRDHTTHIFIEFIEGKREEVKDWIRSFADEYVTSCHTQLRERDILKATNVPGGVFSAFFLSATGYQKLGYSSTQFGDEGFRAGLRARREITRDPHNDTWDLGLSGEIDAMILLADDEINRMSLHAKFIMKDLEEIGRVTAVEYGHALRNSNKDGIEHFGYVDGVSQPLFLIDEIEKYEQRHGISLNEPDSPDVKFDPSASTDLVLIEDPYAMNENPVNYGSYFVFRKLEQNVRGFKSAEEAIGKALFPDDEEKQEIAGAYIVGRYENGSPIIESEEDDEVKDPGTFNNFNYKSDPSGGMCPHFAHIRKTNPRGDLKGAENFKSHIMARRGIPFGHREVDPTLDPAPEQLPTEGVGLLFMSYQASIENQFEFIQSKWANTANFPTTVGGDLTGVDLIIGQPHQNQDPRSYKFPVPYGSEITKSHTMEQFVTMKGGQYFFAPSIAFLKKMN